MFTVGVMLLYDSYYFSPLQTFAIIFAKEFDSIRFSNVEIEKLSRFLNILFTDSEVRAKNHRVLIF